LNTGFLETTIDFGSDFTKLRGLRRPNIIGIFFLDRIVVFNLLTYVVEFFQVASVASFCVFFSFTDVSALAGEAGDLVFLFYIIGLCEESLDD